MKKTIAFLCVLMALGCSSERLAQFHYRKALKHGLKLISDSDTIRITSIDSFPVIKNDTIVYDKFITTKDTIINFRNIYIPKTQWQTRIEYRYKVKVLKQDVLKYKYIYRSEKKKVAKVNWMLFVWGFISAIVLNLAIRVVRKLYF